MKRCLIYCGIILALCLALLKIMVCQVVMGQVPGGAIDAATDDKKIVAAAKFAIEAEQKALKVQGHNESLALLKIVSAHKQVVAGLNYFLTLNVKLGDKETTANATVYERAWENKIELTDWKFTDDTAEGVKGGAVAPNSAPAPTGTVRKPVAFCVHNGYFVSNKFEPDAATSFMVITDQTAFDAAFKATPPLLGQQPKPQLLPPNSFETKIVVAAVHRGKGEWTYKGHSVQLEGHTLVVRYGVLPRERTFETACPMIISVSKGDYTAVRFVENTREVKTLDLGRGAATHSADAAKGG